MALIKGARKDTHEAFLTLKGIRTGPRRKARVEKLIIKVKVQNSPTSFEGLALSTEWGTPFINRLSPSLTLSPPTPLSLRNVTL